MKSWRFLDNMSKAAFSAKGQPGLDLETNPLSLDCLDPECPVTNIFFFFFLKRRSMASRNGKGEGRWGTPGGIDRTRGLRCVRIAAALALVAVVATAASRGGALFRGAAPSVAGLLSVPADRAALKGALAAVKGREPAPGVRGMAPPPRAAGWSIEKLLKNGLAWDGKKDVKAGRNVIMVPPPLIVPRPPNIVTINGKNAADAAEEEANKEKMLIPVKALDALETMNRHASFSIFSAPVRFLHKRRHMLMFENWWQAQQGGPGATTASARRCQSRRST